MNVIQTLVELQAVDQEWDEKAQLFQAARARLEDHSELQAQREAQKRIEKTLASTRARLRDAELELQGLQQKAAELEVRLYSGRIVAPRELEELRRDKEYVRHRIDGIEDQALASMAEVEHLENEQSSGQERLRATEERWAGEQESLTAEYNALRARLVQLKGRRQDLRQNLGRAELLLYDELRSKKGGMALSLIKDAVCQTCRVTVPSRKAQLVRTGNDVITCEGCGRILYEG